MNDNKLVIKKWIALALIIIVSFVGNQFFLDLKNYQIKDNVIKDFTETCFIIIIYTIGIIGLKRNLKRWLMNLWSAFYIIFLLFFVFMALINNFIYRFEHNEQYRFASIKQLLINPLVYLIFLGMDKITENKF